MESLSIPEVGRKYGFLDYARKPSFILEYPIETVHKVPMNIW